MRSLDKADFKLSVKEIGSYYSISADHLRKCENTEPKTLLQCDDTILLSTCRSAISMVLSHLHSDKKKALLPGFTCHAVVEPFIKAGYDVYPYSLNSDLSIDLEKLLKAIEDVNPSVILIHDYFGFDTNTNLRNSNVADLIRSQGIKIILDMTQSMFSLYPRIEADFYLGSIRKWMGIPDGAFLKGCIPSSKLIPDHELEQYKLKAMLYKDGYLFNDFGDKKTLLSLYRDAENILDSRIQPHAMSNTSLKLANHYDLSLYSSIRRENAAVLLDELKHTDKIILPCRRISELITPFYVPIFLKSNRKELQSFLAEKNIYATIIWGFVEEFENKIDFKTHEIYNRILCIPCDQRYNRSDMFYICKLINQFFENIE